MTNKEIMDIAMQQSAYDTNAKVSDFLQDTNVFVKSADDKSVVSFYERFVWRMELMLEHCPSEYGHISFMGP